MAVAAHAEVRVVALCRAAAPCAELAIEISVGVLDAPALVGVFAFAAHEVRPAGLVVRKLAPAGIREHVADPRAQDVVVVVDEDVPLCCATRRA